MTDEELADKYAEEYFGKKIELVELWKVKSYKEAFLAGLKAGSPQWHKVADGDLPKKTDEYLVYRISGYGSKSIELVQYNSSRHFWCVDCQNEVIAWKEIVLPELKESE
jgi:hypothetical protein